MKELYNTKPRSTLGTPLGNTGYIITSARNNVEVNEAAFRTVKNLSEYLNYPLLVGAEYLNPNDYIENPDYEDKFWWDKKLIPYMFSDRIELFNSSIVLSGHIRQPATIQSPLNIFSKKRDGFLNILPSSKFHCEPNLRHVSEKYPTYNCTTGTITPGSFGNQSTGYKAQLEEQMGCVIAYPKKDGYFSFRQLEIDENGILYDVHHRVSPNGVTEGHFLDLVYGFDLHIEEAVKNPEILKSFNEFLWKEKVNILSIGDLVSWEYSHHLGDLQRSMKKGGFNLWESFDLLSEWADQLPLTVDVVVPASNHHDHIEVFIDSVMKKGLKDSSLWGDFVELAHYKFQNPKQSILQSVMEDMNPLCGNWKWLKESEDFTHNGVSNGQHGHNGICGARGSIPGLKKLKRPINHGHTHKGYRLGPNMGSGVSCFTSDLDYANKGYTDHSISAIGQYPNGARSLFHYINGEWS